MKITKRWPRNLLTFVILTLLTAICCVALRYIIGFVFDLFGGEDSIGWASILILCAVLSVAILFVEFIVTRKGANGRVREAIAVCRKIIVIATIMFAGFVLMETMCGTSGDAEASFDTAKWLSLSLSLGLFNTLYERRQ